MDCPTNIYPYRLSDMIAGAITHGLGVFLAILGTAVLLAKASGTHSAITITSALIFGVSLIFSYFSSTLYHALTRTRARKIFHILDHCLIYLLIAGTYTPLVLVTLRGALGWVVFAAVWFLAIVGIAGKILFIGKHPKASAALYLAMGWLAVLFIVPLCRALPPHAIIFLVCGGLCYTVGILFFSFDRIPHFHSIWHLFVLGGSIFHYFLILNYVI